MTQVHRTYCRNCEALCGLIAITDNDTVVELRPDADHTVSKGYACKKGLAMGDIHRHPDRVISPLRRQPDGSFVSVSWDEALDGIGSRLARIIDSYGSDSVGMYLGNPSAFSATQGVAAGLFMRALGSRQLYSPISQDSGSRFAASALLYGDPAIIPVPDLGDVDVLMIIGANPFVSNGSAIVAPRIGQRLRDITARGGRIVVVDPRRSETARAFEHVPIRPGSDVWLLLGMLKVILDDGLIDAQAATHYAGFATLANEIAALSLESVAIHTGIPLADMRALAHALATADRAAIYSRTGVCTSRHGTLLAYLIDAFVILTGNLDTCGGMLRRPLPWPVKLIARIGGLSGYQRWSQDGLPEVMSFLPAVALNKKLDQTAENPLRALVVSSGNPVVSVPGGSRLAEHISKLDLVVCIDLFVNETSRHADYILPATTWLERPDTQVHFLPLMLQPTVQWTDAVVAPRGSAKQERHIFAALLAALRGGTITQRLMRAVVVAALSVDLTIPMSLAVRLITLIGAYRVAPLGLSLHRSRGGHAIDTKPVKRRNRRQVARRIDLAPAPVMEEIRKLSEPAQDSSQRFPYLLIGRRQFTSLNSWLHVGSASTKQPFLLMGRSDAQAERIDDGDRVRVESASGSVVAVVKLTDDLMRGVVSLPHGWGSGTHAANVNDLTPSDTSSLERLAGMAQLNGVAVNIRPVCLDTVRTAM